MYHQYRLLSVLQGKAVRVFSGQMYHQYRLLSVLQGKAVRVFSGQMYHQYRLLSVLQGKAVRVFSGQMYHQGRWILHVKNMKHKIPRMIGLPEISQASRKSDIYF
jgi:hypothetical protein